MRFSLGSHTAAGWVILDSRNMAIAYVNVTTQERAQEYVNICNLMDDIKNERDAKVADAQRRLRALLEGMGRNAA